MGGCRRLRSPTCPAPTDPDCRLGDDPIEDYQFHADPKDDYPHFFNVP